MPINMQNVDPEGLQLGETSTTAYRGDRGKMAYDHSKLTSGNPHNVTKSDIGLAKVENTSDAEKRVLFASTAGSAQSADSAERAEKDEYGNNIHDTYCMNNDSRLSDSRPASDVASWAKAPTKPSYSYSEIQNAPNVPVYKLLKIPIEAMYDSGNTAFPYMGSFDYHIGTNKIDYIFVERLVNDDATETIPSDVILSGISYDTDRVSGRILSMTQNAEYFLYVRYCEDAD